VVGDGVVGAGFAIGESKVGDSVTVGDRLGNGETVGDRLGNGETVGDRLASVETVGGKVGPLTGVVDSLVGAGVFSVGDRLVTGKSVGDIVGGNVIVGINVVVAAQRGLSVSETVTLDTVVTSRKVRSVDDFNLSVNSVRFRSLSNGSVANNSGVIVGSILSYVIVWVYMMRTL
jgi:hypothetical protein